MTGTKEKHNDCTNSKYGTDHPRQTTTLRGPDGVDPDRAPWPACVMGSPHRTSSKSPRRVTATGLALMRDRARGANHPTV
jgi:hypothetical protein